MAAPVSLTVTARGVGGRDTGECALTCASGNAAMRGAWGAEGDGERQGRGDAGTPGCGVRWACGAAGVSLSSASTVLA